MGPHKILLENPKHAEHVDIALVHEGFLIMRSFPSHVAKMDVGDLGLPAVAINSIVNIAFGHFGQRAEAEFEGVAWARSPVDEALVEMRQVHEPGLASHRRGGRIVGMGCKGDACFFRNRNERVEKFAVPPPQFLLRNRR